MKYTEETAEKEFQFYSSFYKDNEMVNNFVELLNLYYDCIKSAPMRVVKSLLPIDYIGHNGKYLDGSTDSIIHSFRYVPLWPI